MIEAMNELAKLQIEAKMLDGNTDLTAVNPTITNKQATQTT